MSAEMCPKPLNCSGVYGDLTIAGWSLHTGAWCAHDLSPLFDSPEFRGDNVLIESEVGRSARTIVTDETEYSLRMMFSGAVDRLGAAYVNPVGGLLANRSAFVGQIIDPIRTATATLTAVLTIPDPTDPAATIALEFDCQPIRLTGWTLLPDGYARTVLRLRVPVPTFVESV